MYEDIGCYPNFVYGYVSPRYSNDPYCHRPSPCYFYSHSHQNAHDAKLLQKPPSKLNNEIKGLRLGYLSSDGLTFTKGRLKQILLSHTEKAQYSGPDRATFKATKKPLTQLLNNAWSKKKQFERMNDDGSSQPLIWEGGFPEETIHLMKDNVGYIIPMGKEIGTKGERLLFMELTPGTNEVITAYPYNIKGLNYQNGKFVSNSGLIFDNLTLYKLGENLQGNVNLVALIASLDNAWSNKAVVPPSRHKRTYSGSDYYVFKDHENVVEIELKENTNEVMRATHWKWRRNVKPSATLRP